MNPILFTLVGLVLSVLLALLLLVEVCWRWWRLAHPIIPDDVDEEREVRRVLRAPDPLSAIQSGPWNIGSDRAAGSALICRYIQAESLSAGVWLVRWEFCERPEY